MIQNSHKKHVVRVGDCKVGAFIDGHKDIIVQSMTNTDTADIRVYVDLLMRGKATFGWWHGFAVRVRCGCGKQ